MLFQIHIEHEYLRVTVSYVVTPYVLLAMHHLDASAQSTDTFTPSPYVRTYSLQKPPSECLVLLVRMLNERAFLPA